MTSTVEYQGALRTAALHLASNQAIITDAPVDNNGKGEAFSPTDLVATALASCMLTIMGILADRKGWDIAGTKASVLKVMASNPRRIARVEVQFDMPARGYSDEARSMLEHAARTCPVAHSLHTDIEQVIVFNWL